MYRVALRICCGTVSRECCSRRHTSCGSLQLRGKANVTDGGMLCVSDTMCPAGIDDSYYDTGRAAMAIQVPVGSTFMTC